MTINENAHLIDLISTHTKTLLENHWSDIMEFRTDGNGDSIKIGFSHDLSYEGQERIIESTISFGKRVKDSTIDRIDTQQLNFELPQTGPKRTRNRGKKSAPLGAVSKFDDKPAENLDPGEAA
jgi:hypothetical protein